jgi:lipopolysaccharide export LptBFGC system permease protein LptF
MKFFLAFLFLALIAPLLVRRAKQRGITLLMLLASAGVAFGYYFLNQI